MYRIEVSPAAERDLYKLKKRTIEQDFRRLKESIGRLASEPRPFGVRKLRGFENTYRIRVGDYRVIYDVHENDRLVILLMVVRRSETTYK